MTHIRIILVEMFKGRFKFFQLGRRDIGMCRRHHLGFISSIGQHYTELTADLIFHKSDLLPDVRLGKLELILQIIERQDRIVVLFDFSF